MAIKKAARPRAEFDWYLISIDRLKQIGLIILLLALGLAGWWFFTNQKRNPRSAAEAAIADAREALNALASSKDFTNHRSEFDRAQKKLDDATTALTSGKRRGFVGPIPCTGCCAVGGDGWASCLSSSRWRAMESWRALAREARATRYTASASFPSTITGSSP